MKEKNFGYLGFDFQQTLLKAIIEDKKYAERIITILESKYFENASFKFIMENIKEFYYEFNRIPDYINLAQKIISDNGDNLSTKIHLDTLESLKNHNSNPDYAKKSALNFCRQQNLKRVMKVADNIIEKGNFEEYDSLEGLFKKALEVGLEDDPISDIFENIDDTLSANYRHPIPTGIVGVDNLLKGGLGRGELAIVLAPTGTGKTTILTKFANTAYNCGFNVLQIFFEDNIGNIKRKHYTIWSNIAPDDQPEKKDEVMEIVTKKQKEAKGVLKLLKLQSSDVSISELKTKIRKMQSDGLQFDLLVLDYIDCIAPEKSINSDEWKGEGAIMRNLESMASEFELAIWTATQGSRDSISSEIVNTDQMGGSIKKAQIAHVILSIGKTIPQKEHNLATLTLLKSRIGKDGVVFQNCKFNNEYIDIDTETQNTLLGLQEDDGDKERKNNERVKAAYQRAQESKKINKV